MPQKKPLIAKYFFTDIEPPPGAFEEAQRIYCRWLIDDYLRRQETAKKQPSIPNASMSATDTASEPTTKNSLPSK